MKANQIKNQIENQLQNQLATFSMLNSALPAISQIAQTSPTFSLNPRNSPSITLTIGLSILPTVPKSPPLSWIPPTRNPTGTSKLP